MKKVFFSILFLFIIISGNAQEWQFKNVNLQGMGFVSGIAIHPQSKDIYVRTDVGGAYRWNKDTENWIPITDWQVESYNIEALALNPSNQNEVYIVSGNKSQSKFYKSADKGTTWKLIPGLQVYTEGNGYWRNSDPRLLIDPNNMGKVMLYASRKDGLQKSIDAGISWQIIPLSKVPAGIQKDGGISFVVFDRKSGSKTQNSQIIYAGVSGYGIYKTTDGGESWILLNTGPAISYKPVCADMDTLGNLFVTYSNATTEKKWDDGGDGRVYRFSAAGTGTDITPGDYCKMNFAGIDVLDSNPDKIVTFEWKFGQINGIHYSTDGGKTWSPRKYTNSKVTKPQWYDEVNSTWTFAGGAAFDPYDENKVWLTTGFGVMTLEDIRQSDPNYVYRMKGLEELVVMQVKSLPHPCTTRLLVGVADVRGFAISGTTQVPTACFDNGTFGITSCFDYSENDPLTIVRVGDTEQYWKSTGFGYITHNGGQSWNAFGSKPVNAANGNIAISASNKRVMVWAPINYQACGWSVLPHYTTDGGSSWFACSGIPAGDNECTEEWSASRFLVSDRVNGNTFYYYSFKNGETPAFFRSTDGGKNFSQVFTASLLGYYKVKLQALPNKEGHLLFCARNGSPLYLSDNKGSSWQALPSVDKCYTYGIGRNIGNSSSPSIYMHGEVKGVKGTYFSADMGSTWTLIKEGQVPGGCLDIEGDLKEEYRFYIATGGRGVFFGSNSIATSEFQPKIMESDYDINVFPNPAKGGFKFSVNTLQPEKVQFLIYNSSGILIHSQSETITKGENIFTVSAEELKIVPGIFILNLQTDKHKLQKKICIN